MSEAYGWTAHTSRTAYENAWLRLREDRVTRPDGSAGLYGVVEVKNEAVFVVACTDADEVVMVRVYRYPTDVVSLEVPAGGMDPGEAPEAAARRELAEEAGLTADAWEHVGSMWALNGLAHARQHVYLARGLRPLANDHGTRAEQRLEGISEVRLVPWPEAIRMLQAGEISDGEAIAALSLAALRCGRLVSSDAAHPRHNR